MSGRVLALLALAAMAVPGGPRSGWAFPGAGESPPGGVLLVEITPAEGALQVAQAWFPGTAAGSRVFPLLLPEDGPGPEIRPAVGEDSGGLQVRGRGGARAEFRDGTLRLAGQPDGSGEFALEVTYRVPVTTSRLMFRVLVNDPLDRVQVIHQGGAHALHVRPLRPYAFREEDEGDGAWRYQDVPGPLRSGETLRVAVRRLPEARRPYRWAGAALLGTVGIFGLLVALRRRDGRGR